MNFIRTFVMAGIAGSAAIAPAALFAQDAADYPNKPITVVVPWAAGGAADIIARLVAEPLGAELGQPVVIENRPGAGGTVGSATVARAEPDGYTLLMGNVSSQAIAPAFFADTIPYNVLEDFAPISQLIEQPSVVLVDDEFEGNTLDAMVEYVRKNPGETYGTPGVGNSPFLTFELIKSSYDLDMTNIPYDSGGEVNNALTSGDIRIAINNMPEAMQAITNGVAKPVAITSPERNPMLPDVPTFGEQGNDQIVAISWQGLFAPAGTPDAIIDKIHAAATVALQAPAVVEQNDRLGSVPVGSTPAEFRDFISSELESWAGMVALANEGAK